MKPESQQFFIPFTGLKDGLHYFRFEADDAFFNRFEYSQVQKARVVISIAFTRHPDYFEMKLDLDGTTEVECDRCMETFRLPVSGEFDVFVKYYDGIQQTDSDEDPEVILIPDKAIRVELDQLIYELVHLCLPVSRVHSEDEKGVPGCDPRALALIDQDFLKTAKEKKETDPRWDKLKTLKNKKH